MGGGETEDLGPWTLDWGFLNRELRERRERGREASKQTSKERNTYLATKGAEGTKLGMKDET
jgi:hypothetical protein